MNKIEQSVFNAIVAGKKYLIAVSGGADSMVLLAIANNAAKQKDAFIRAVTVEHGIRGKNSTRDAEFVKEYCKHHSIECKIVHINVPKAASENKQTIEESARNLRYKALFEELNTNETLVVAHNQNDQAETVLMHIFRGSGLDGAKGIASSGKILRPLLNTTKAEIVSYANANGINFVHDETNDDTNYTRNFVRKEIMPKIEQIYPGALDGITRFAEYAAECSSLIEELANNNYVVVNNDSVHICSSALEQNNLVFAKIIKNAYNLLGEYSDLESKHISIIKDFWLSSKNGATINIPHGIIIEKREGELVLYKTTSNNSKVGKFVLGQNVLPNGQIVVAEKITKEQVEFGSGDYYADYYKIPFDAVWRYKQDGDRFQKLGAHGSKKLSDYFTDKKFNFAKRNSQIVLAKDSSVLYVHGEDISNNIKIDDKTEVIIKLSLKK